MTRTNEMTNSQARTKHRTTAQIAELCLQSAEDYHQQYLSDAKVPYGYCPDHGTGVACPVGLMRADG
jgi:peptide-methionine (S)-S-oxide reductase